MDYRRRGGTKERHEEHILRCLRASVVKKVSGLALMYGVSLVEAQCGHRIDPRIQRQVEVDQQSPFITVAQLSRERVGSTGASGSAVCKGEALW